MPHPEVSLVSPLVSSCQHLLQSNGSIDGNEVADAILPNFPCLSSAIPADYFAGKNGILSIDGRKPLTHYRIREFIMANIGPVLHGMGYGRGHRIALVLPNGPELALAILAVSNWASCVPLNANGATVELQKDLQMSGASMVIGMTDNAAIIKDMAKALHIPFCGLKPSKTEAGIFDLVPMSMSMSMYAPTSASTTISTSTTTSPRRNGRVQPDSDNDTCCNPGAFDDKASSSLAADSETNFLSNEHDDEVIVLFTSGTTGTKKLVPHKLGDMLIASACIALSWNLKPDDVNCNLMPLFHVGGIVRQVFAPILSAGSVICCPAFDPITFWNLLKDDKFTWYYAAPTMHQIILANLPPATGIGNGNNGNGNDHNYKLRMIANAAGGLLPSLAEELRAVFGANVLPSYGMTECMPISSPPASYQLEKPGTSGVAVGPQIRIFSNNYDMQTPGREGHICVRGRPCFGGYGGVDQESCFQEGGWFNTGDLGYLDQDGYLFITGRSKEVINRGGEIISPLEVEEAVLSHPTVHNCLAFSAVHDVLQEVVGIVVVTKPGTPRVDLSTLHEFLQEKLTLQKWPQCLVFMDGLPKSHTNKLLRVKMGQRLNLPILDNSMSLLQRTFEARCPPQGTPVGVSIPSFNVNVDMAYVQATLREELKINKDLLGAPQDLLLALHPSKYGVLVAHVYNVDRIDMIRAAQNKLDAYLVPSHICQYSDLIDPDRLKPLQHTDSIASLLQDSTGPVDPLVQDLQEVVRELLDLDCIPAPDTNFFHVGGSSLLASQLASKIRKRHNVSFPGADVFRHSSCEAMAKRIQEQMSAHKAISSRGPSLDEFGREIDADINKLENLAGVTFEMQRLAPETSWLRSLFQLVPLFVVFPVWQLCRFFFFFICLFSALKHAPGKSNKWKIVLTLVVYNFMWETVTPLIFVLIKWVVIGRYKKGRHAIWSTYYLRWWFVDVCRKMVGCGIWGSHSASLRVYYRMLGATIGEGVRFSLNADIAEYDLVTIGDYAKIEYSSVRGFGVDNGAMLLGPVNVGPYSSVGALSVVAPSTSIPANHHMGPAASSYEVLNWDDKHFAYNRQALPEPSVLMQIFVGHPILFLVQTFSCIPALTILLLKITLQTRHAHDGLFPIGDVLEWLCDVRRIPYYVGIRVVRTIVAPFMYMVGAIVVKKLVIGKFEPGPRDTSSDWQLLRHWLAAKLFSRENMQGITEILGRHYEPISILYRLLGAKIGKRVFWPGHHPEFTGEFDLLEIGDDVVFGSRCAIFCTTIDSCEKVMFCAGANVSDNTVVLPGSIVGKNAVLGSNTVCPRGRYLPESSIWIGADKGEPILLEDGPETINKGVVWSSDVKESELPMQGDDSTLRPFGKAVYLGEAPYRVWHPFFMILFNVFCITLFECVHAFPLIGSLHLTGGLLYGWSFQDRDYDGMGYTAGDLFSTLILIFFALHVLRVFICLAIEIAAKWGYLRRRQEGRYNWDNCDYGQNWEFYQLLTSIRKLQGTSILDFIAGTPFMNTYFRLLGSKIGKDCCLYPAGGDPYMPEPDLVTMGDRCVVDLSSIVCHLNTRGNFELIKITIGNHVTLRSRSRIQQGVNMESGSMLLEKSLALTGEVIDADSVWQGAPASEIFSYAHGSGILPSTSKAFETNGGNLSFLSVVGSWTSTLSVSPWVGWKVEKDKKE